MEILDKTKQMEVLYTDCSKTFDKTDYGILMGKLRNFGFSLNVITLLYSYLNDNKLFEANNGYASFTYEATSGVPHSSFLGPLLIPLFINDLCQIISCYKFYFGDDLKISMIMPIASCELDRDSSYFALTIRAPVEVLFALNIIDC